MTTGQQTKPKRPYYGGARKRTGVLIRNRTGYSARFWAVVDGENVRVTKPLGTDNRQVAKRKMAKLVAAADPIALDAAAPETFAEAALRIFEARLAAGIKSARDERSRLVRFAFDEIGPRPVTQIESRHVNEVLDGVHRAKKSKQTAQHVKQAMSNVFAALKREGTIKINPCDDAELPTYARKLTKTRAVLSASELETYLRWAHPDPRYALAVRERQVMACLVLCFGGLRTGDLHAMQWRHLNPPEFLAGVVLRQKTGKPHTLRIDPMLRPVLLDWYERHPKQNGLNDPVFPKLRAHKSDAEGSGKTKGSHAKAFRRDLARAFGLEVWNPAVDGWQAAERQPTQRERELLKGTKEQAPIDFHSLRRGFRQALDAAGADINTVRTLGGWESKAEARYLENPDTIIEIPAGALPKALPLPAMVRAKDHR